MGSGTGMEKCEQQQDAIDLWNGGSIESNESSLSSHETCRERTNEHDTMADDKIMRLPVHQHQSTQALPGRQ
jgi:hypothetical protein